MRSYEDYLLKKNSKLAFILGKDTPICQKCGYRLCSCQTKLTELEPRFNKILDKAIELSQAKYPNHELRDIILSLCNNNPDFKDFCIRHKIYTENDPDKD